eukprot:TRINITY_DN8282_c2_g6_i2.p1 TRINITY_DN8282_c2_g6~~TRINITY_DN8282_c2_g6_i2.p1  ORF type:complete len:310 (-),score=18.68 TRINITY_DN8282_c2_g6_i2:312-1241(-)
MDCPICINAFDPGQHLPLVFPCGHTFCKECSSQLERRGRLQCPTCRKPTRASEIKLNYAFRDALCDLHGIASQDIEYVRQPLEDVRRLGFSALGSAKWEDMTALGIYALLGAFSGLFFFCWALPNSEADMLVPNCVSTIRGIPHRYLRLFRSIGMLFGPVTVLPAVMCASIFSPILVLIDVPCGLISSSTACLHERSDMNAATVAALGGFCLPLWTWQWHMRSGRGWLDVILDRDDTCQSGRISHRHQVTSLLQSCGLGSLLGFAYVGIGYLPEKHPLRRLLAASIGLRAIRIAATKPGFVSWLKQIFV